MSGGWGSAWAGRLGFGAWRCLTRGRRPQTVGRCRPRRSSDPPSMRCWPNSSGTSRWSGAARRTPCGPTAPTSTGLLAGLDDSRPARPRRAAPLARGRARAGASRSTLARRAAAARTFTAWARRTGHAGRRPGVRLGRRRDPGPRCRPCSTWSRPPRVLDAAGSGAEEGEPVALRDLWCWSCSTPPGSGSPSCAGSTSTTSTTERRALRVLGKGDRRATVVYGVPAGAALRRWLAAGRPALVRAGSPPALLLGARGGRLDPRVARSVVHRRADRRARRAGRRAARSPTRCRHAHDGGRRGPPLRTGVTRSR